MAQLWPDWGAGRVIVSDLSASPSDGFRSRADAVIDLAGGILSARRLLEDGAHVVIGQLALQVPVLRPSSGQRPVEWFSIRCDSSRSGVMLNPNMIFRKTLFEVRGSIPLPILARSHCWGLAAGCRTADARRRL